MMTTQYSTLPLIRCQDPARRVTPPGGRGGKLYSQAWGGEENLNRFKSAAKSRDNNSTETIKELLKNKINTTEIKVGINIFK